MYSVDTITDLAYQSLITLCASRRGITACSLRNSLAIRCTPAFFPGSAPLSHRSECQQVAPATHGNVAEQMRRARISLRDTHTLMLRMATLPQVQIRLEAFVALFVAQSDMTTGRLSTLSATRLLTNRVDGVILSLSTKKGVLHGSK